MTTQVCDECGHIAPHDAAPTVLVPYQPRGTTSHVTLTTNKCRNANCFCNVPVWRDLLPSEPAL